MTTPSATYITFCAQTNLGQLRQGNEDNFLILDLAQETSWNGIEKAEATIQSHPLNAPGFVLAVSDGMGGALAGEVASRMAVEIVSDLMPQLLAHEEYSKLSLPEQLRVAIEQANSAIHIESIVNSNCRGMGATFTAVAINNGKAYFAQIGDSRAHLIRRGQITRITKDQSVVQQLIDLGQITEEEAEKHPRKNYILQALGAAHEIDVVISSLPLAADDVLLLCSDGLSGKMSPDEMAQIVTEARDFELACSQLIKLANDRGGEDNITVLLALITGENLVTPGEEQVQPETLPRPESTPTDFLLDDVGLSPPLDDSRQRDESITIDFSPKAIENPTITDIDSDKIAPVIETPATTAKPRIAGSTIITILAGLVVLTIVTAIYLNSRFTPGRTVLQQQLQQDNLTSINNLRSRIASLRTREGNTPDIISLLDLLSLRLDEAAALPASQYQKAGQACSEVAAALDGMEKQAKPK